MNVNDDSLLAQFLPKVDIAYIGKKAKKKDTLTGSRTVWNGYGDVKSVDAVNAQELLQYPDVFVLAEKLDEHKKEKAEADKLAEEEAKAIAEAEEKARLEAEEAAKKKAEDFEPEKIELIQKAIIELDPNNNEHFFKSSQKPKTKAVKAMMGEAGAEVTEEEVEFAFAQLG